MEVLPLQKWKSLYTKGVQGDKLYDTITTILENECFDPEVEYTIPYLRKCLPLYEKRCHEVIEKKMSVAYDIAKSVGFNEMAKLKRYKQARVIFESAMTLLLSFRRDLIDQAGITLFRSVPELLEKYPEFSDQLDVELNLLLEFANYMKVVLLLLPPKGKKAHLLEIVTRLTEGKNAKYVCGGGQTPATARRVKIYEEEGGNKPAARPFRMPWLDLYEILTGDNEDQDNMPAQIIDAVEERDEFGFTDNLDRHTHFFRHPLVPEVEVEATEMLAPDGLTLVRAMSVSKVQEDASGNVIVRTPIARSVSATQQVQKGKGKGSVFWNDDEIQNVEEKMADGVLVARQTNKIEGQLVRGVSIARQISPHSEDDAFDLFGEELNLSDWMRGGSFGSCGQSGMFRSLSGGSSMPGSRTESQKSECNCESPLGKRRAGGMFISTEPILRALSRSTSQSQAPTPKAAGSSGLKYMTPSPVGGVGGMGQGKRIKLDMSSSMLGKQSDEEDANGATSAMWDALLTKNSARQG
jgi:hypothetical protein